MKKTVLIIQPGDDVSELALNGVNAPDVIVIEEAYQQHRGAQYLLWMRPRFKELHGSSFWRFGGEIIKADYSKDHADGMAEAEYATKNLTERAVLLARSIGYEEIRFISEHANPAVGEAEAETIATQEEIE